MSAYELPAWLDIRFIENALSRTAAPDKAELRDILDKSLALKSLTIQEATALMRVTDPEDVALMMKTADAVKQKAYGDRIVLTAPLHISNHCGSECLYCANRKSNTLIQRKYMTSPEMREAAGKLIRQGHKRIVLVSGQLPNADVEYLAEAISIMYTVFDGHGEVRRVNVNVGPLNADQYSVLLDADVGTVLIYQDTYHPDYYKAAHVAGPKSHYEKRLNAPEVALGAGVRDVGLGLLLGLAPWQFDVLATMLHVAHLNRLFGAGGGMVLVPLLTMLTTLDDREVFPSSIAIILPICVVSIVVTSAMRTIDWPQAAPYLLGSLLGGLAAGKWGRAIPTAWLHRGLGILILWGGFRYLC